jgi:hypothetical protein
MSGCDTLGEQEFWYAEEGDRLLKRTNRTYVILMMMTMF